MGWRNHGFQVTSQNQSKGEASCQGSRSKDVLGIHRSTLEQRTKEKFLAEQRMSKHGLVFGNELLSNLSHFSLITKQIIKRLVIVIFSFKFIGLRNFILFYEFYIIFKAGHFGINSVLMPFFLYKLGYVVL